MDQLKEGEPREKKAESEPKPYDAFDRFKKKR
jgi:hypothetical protein